MYLTERLVSLLIFFTTMIFTYLILQKVELKKQGKILIIYIFILSVMAYCYKPLVTADLYRIQESLRGYYYNMNITKLFETLSNSLTPVATIYYFFFSKFNNTSLLPFFTSLVFYSNVFYILYDYAKIKGLKNSSVANSFLFFMLAGQYLEVISGIRCLMGFSIIANCIYKEYYKNKSIVKNIILYIIASLLHPACLVLTVIRMGIYIFKENKKSILVRMISIIIILIFAYYGLPYISSAFEYGEGYLNGNVYSYSWEYIIAFILVLFMIANCIFYKKHIREINRNYIGFLTILIFGLLILFFEYSIFHRFSIFLSMIGLPMIESNISYLKSNIKSYSKLNFLFYLIIIAIGVIVFTRGNLCGFKMF